MILESPKIQLHCYQCDVHQEFYLFPQSWILASTSCDGRVDPKIHRKLQFHFFVAHPPVQISFCFNTKLRKNPLRDIKHWGKVARTIKFPNESLTGRVARNHVGHSCAHVVSGFQDQDNIEPHRVFAYLTSALILVLWNSAQLHTHSGRNNPQFCHGLIRSSVLHRVRGIGNGTLAVVKVVILPKRLTFNCCKERIIHVLSVDVALTARLWVSVTDRYRK